VWATIVVAALLLLSVILDGVLPSMGNTAASGRAILNHITTYKKADTTLAYELCAKDTSNM
jgi:hypothetical protein